MAANIGFAVGLLPASQQLSRQDRRPRLRMSLIPVARSTAHIGIIGRRGCIQLRQAVNHLQSK